MLTEDKMIIVNLLFFLMLFVGVELLPSLAICAPYLLGALALLAIAVPWYNKRVIDRIYLTFYLTVLTICIMSCFDISPNNFIPIQSRDLIYIIFIMVGIYTTFCTRVGFVGITAGNARVIRKTSLMMLAISIVVGCGAIYLGNKDGVQFFAYLILICSYYMLKYYVKKQSL